VKATNRKLKQLHVSSDLHDALRRYRADVIDTTSMRKSLTALTEEALFAKYPVLKEYIRDIRREQNDGSDK